MGAAVPIIGLGLTAVGTIGGIAGGGTQEVNSQAMAQASIEAIDAARENLEQEKELLDAQKGMNDEYALWAYDTQLAQLEAQRKVYEAQLIGQYEVNEVNRQFAQVQSDTSHYINESQLGLQGVSNQYQYEKAQREYQASLELIQAKNDLLAGQYAYEQGEAASKRTTITGQQNLTNQLYTIDQQGLADYLGTLNTTYEIEQQGIRREQEFNNQQLDITQTGIERQKGEEAQQLDITQRGIERQKGEAEQQLDITQRGIERQKSEAGQQLDITQRGIERQKGEAAQQLELEKALTGENRQYIDAVTILKDAGFDLNEENINTIRSLQEQGYDIDADNLSLYKTKLNEDLRIEANKLSLQRKNARIIQDLQQQGYDITQSDLDLYQTRLGEQLSIEQQQLSLEERNSQIIQDLQQQGFDINENDLEQYKTKITEEHEQGTELVELEKANVIVEKALMDAGIAISHDDLQLYVEKLGAGKQYSTAEIESVVQDALANSGLDREQIDEAARHASSEYGNAVSEYNLSVETGAAQATTTELAAQQEKFASITTAVNKLYGNEKWYSDFISKRAARGGNFSGVNILRDSMNDPTLTSQLQAADMNLASQYAVAETQKQLSDQAAALELSAAGNEYQTALTEADISERRTRLTDKRAIEHGQYGLGMLQNEYEYGMGTTANQERQLELQRQQAEQTYGVEMGRLDIQQQGLNTTYNYGMNTTQNQIARNELERQQSAQEYQTQMGRYGLQGEELQSGYNYALGQSMNAEQRNELERQQSAQEYQTQMGLYGQEGRGLLSNYKYNMGEARNQGKRIELQRAEADWNQQYQLRANELERQGWSTDAAHQQALIEIQEQQNQLEYERIIGALGQQGEQANLGYQSDIGALSQQGEQANLGYQSTLGALGQQGEQANLGYQRNVGALGQQSQQANLAYNQNRGNLTQQGQLLGVEHGYNTRNVGRQQQSAELTNQQYNAEVQNQLGLLSLQEQLAAQQNQYDVYSQVLLPQYTAEEMRNQEQMDYILQRANLGLMGYGENVSHGMDEWQRQMGSRADKMATRQAYRSMNAEYPYQQNALMAGLYGGLQQNEAAYSQGLMEALNSTSGMISSIGNNLRSSPGSGTDVMGGLSSLVSQVAQALPYLQSSSQPTTQPTTWGFAPQVSYTPYSNYNPQDYSTPSYTGQQTPQQSNWVY